MQFQRRLVGQRHCWQWQAVVGWGMAVPLRRHALMTDTPNQTARKHLRWIAVLAFVASLCAMQILLLTGGLWLTRSDTAWHRWLMCGYSIAGLPGDIAMSDERQNQTAAFSVWLADLLAQPSPLTGSIAADLQAAMGREGVTKAGMVRIIEELRGNVRNGQSMTATPSQTAELPLAHNDLV